MRLLFCLGRHKLLCQQEMSLYIRHEFSGKKLRLFSPTSCHQYYSAEHTLPAQVLGHHIVSGGTTIFLPCLGLDEPVHIHLERQFREGSGCYAQGIGNSQLEFAGGRSRQVIQKQVVVQNKILVLYKTCSVYFHLQPCNFLFSGSESTTACDFYMACYCFYIKPRS